MSRALHTQIRGQGDEVVVLLHGLFGSGRNLASLAHRLADADPRSRIVLPDLTGHGASPPLPEQPTLDDLATDLLVLLDDLASGAPPAAQDPARSVRVVGHSLGGRAALAARRLSPAAVPDLVLLDIAPGRTPPSGAAAGDPRTAAAGSLDRVRDALLAAPATSPDREAMAAFLRGRSLAEPLVQWLLLNLERAPEGGVAWRIDRPRLADLQQASGRDDLWPVIETLPGRTRAIRGARSDFVSDADVARFARAGVPVDTLPDAGHFVHVDALDELVDLLLPHARDLG